MSGQINNPRYNLSGYNQSVRRTRVIERHSITSLNVIVTHSLILKRCSVAEVLSKARATLQPLVPHNINNMRYNLVRYNAGINYRIVRFTRRSIARFEAVIAPTTFHDITRHSFAAFMVQAQLNKVVIITPRHSAAGVYGYARAYKHLVAQRRALSEFFAEAVIAKDVYINRNSLAELKGFVHVGKEIYISRHDNSKAEAAIHVGKHIIIMRHFSAYFNAQVQMSLMDYLLMELNVTIPPGGEIRINSDNFTAVMGNANIIHLMNGDWIFIDRDTHTLRLESVGGGTVVGQLLYVERFI